MQKTISHRNSIISYSIHGQGSCLVLLHGFLENKSIWSPIISQFEKRFKIIALDLPGHGNSDCIGYVHSMDEMAAAVQDVLKTERIRRCILIGHSMGGYVSLAFAEKNLKAVKGLCLLNSTSVADSQQRKEIRDLAIRTAKKNYEKLVRISVRNLFSEENQEALKPKIEEMISEAIKTPLQGYIAAQEGMKLRPNREFILKNANFKKLQITGTKDQVILLEDAKKEAQRTQTQLVVFNGGHMSFIENTIELKKTLALFIRSC